MKKRDKVSKFFDKIDKLIYHITIEMLQNSTEYNRKILIFVFLIWNG